jgi:hypothetical protein
MSDPLMFYVPARPTNHHAVTIGYWLLAIGYWLFLMTGTGGNTMALA